MYRHTDAYKLSAARAAIQRSAMRHTVGTLANVGKASLTLRAYAFAECEVST